MRRSLGKGLSQLIAEQFDAAPAEVAIEQIVPNPGQPRTRFDEEPLRELAESIRLHGVLQPLAVKPVGENRFELIAGERRWRAAQLAGLKSVPVVVRSAGRQESLELALIENLQREDIGPLESARAFRLLIDDFQLTQEEVALRVGKSRAAVANSLRLLRLPARVQEGLEVGKITEGHAKALLGIDQPDRLLAVYDLILERGLTSKDVERLAQEAKGRAPSAKAAESTDPHSRALQDALARYFAAPVKLQPSARGGKLVIDYYSDDDLQRILEVLGIEL